MVIEVGAERPKDSAPAPASRRGLKSLLQVSRPRLLIAALVVGAGAVVLAIAYGLGGGGASSETGVILAMAERGDIEASVTAVGNLQPRDYVDVGAQVSGQIDAIEVEIGDAVKAGDLLVTIDPDVQEARVNAARANLTALKATLVERQAQLELKRAQHARERRLHAEGATSDDALETARTAEAAAAAQLNAISAQIAQSESSLEAEETTLGYTRIIAPMDGTVVSISAKVGQTINASQQAPIILRIADLSTMTVWTQVSEADVSRLEPGFKAYFTTLGSPDERHEGTLRQVLPTPEVLNNVVLYTALFDVPNPEGKLRMQMTAQVFFITASAQDVLLVPSAAVRPARSKGEGAPSHVVTVVGKNGQSERRPVEIGVTDRVNTQIISGLEAGESVVAGRPEGTAKTRGSGLPGAAPGPGGRF